MIGRKELPPPHDDRPEAPLASRRHVHLQRGRTGFVIDDDLWFGNTGERKPLPAERAGASLRELFAMAAYNLGQVLGPGAEDAIRTHLGDPTRFAHYVQPCRIDGRLHAWEWIETVDGTLLKTDALDHHAAHDLVGPQDIAWDIAGAAVEFALAPNLRDELALRVSGATGRTLSNAFLDATTLCYLGFQLGLWTFALGRAAPSDRSGIDSLLARYAAHPALLPFRSDSAPA